MPNIRNSKSDVRNPEHCANCGLLMTEGEAYSFSDDLLCSSDCYREHLDNTPTAPLPPPTTLSSNIQLQDKTGRREFRARLVRAGRITNARGDPGHIVISEGALISAVEAGMFDGLAIFADHPGFLQGPEVKHLIGVTRNASYNNVTQGVDATLRFYTTNSTESTDRLADTIVETLDAILADQNNGIQGPDVGLSLVFWPIWAAGDDRPRILQAFKKIDSADIVFSPAADGRIFEALSTKGAHKGGNDMPHIENVEATADENPQPPAEETTTDSSNTANQPQLQLRPRQPEQPAPPPPQDADAWVDAARQAAIPGILAASGLPQISQDRLGAANWDSPEALRQAIEAEKKYLAELTAQNTIQMPGSHPRGAGQLTVSGMSNGRDAAELAINWLFGVEGAPAPDPLLRRFDQLYVMMTGDLGFHGVYKADQVMLAGADTTALADLAANAMNKVIVDHLASLTHYRWYEQIAVPTANDGSLHDMQWTDVGGITTLSVVTEGAAYDEITMADVKETDSFVKYGGYVGITREMIRKSDIQRIQAVPRALAAASVKTRSAKIAGIFTSNSGVGPTLDQDSVALFHANHSNVATPL